jgi:hypothetical protein
MAFDPTRESQLSEDKLKWGYWWVLHKVQVRKVFTVFMAVLSTILVGYAGFGFFDWFFGSGVRERAQIAALTVSQTDFGAFRDANAPRPLAIEDAQMLQVGEGSYDLFAGISNQNVRWWAEIDYQFLASGVEIKPGKAYLLPGEIKFLRSLGVKSEAGPGSPRLEVTSILWHRVDPHAVKPDYAAWARERLDFAVTDVKFTPPDPADPIAVSRATFTVKNNTAFSYWNVGFFVVLFDGSRIGAVNFVTISELRSGQQRQVDASWFTDLPGVSRVEVTPEVNIFDVRSYIPPGR